MAIYTCGLKLHTRKAQNDPPALVPGVLRMWNVAV